MKTFNDPEVFPRVKRLPAPASAAIDRLRDGARARGMDVIDLATGNPDGTAPEVAFEAIRAAMGRRAQHPDVDPRGLQALREAAAGALARRHGLELDAEREILPTLGAKDGIGHALLAMLQPGDAVLAPAPSTPLHAYGAVLADGETFPVPVGPGVDFWESLVAATERAERRPRGLLVNFPANPTAAMATPELLANIVRFAEARKMFILSDASCCDLAFEGRAPLLLQVPGARERTIEFYSLSRSYDMAGFRIGLAAGNPAMIAALARVRSYLDDGLFGAAQEAAAAVLASCDDVPPRVCERYRERRDALVRAMAAAGWPVPSPSATPFVWAPVPDAVRALGSIEIARRLVEEAGVCVLPGAAFGDRGEGHVRFALTQDSPRLEEAAARLGAWLRKATSEPRPSHTPVPRSVEPA